MAPTPKHVLLPSYSCLVTRSLSCGLVSVETSSACGCWSATRPEEMSSTGFILQGHVEKYMAATIVGFGGTFKTWFYPYFDWNIPVLI